MAVVSCFEEFKNVRYDTRDNATKVCHGNGTWDEYSNYDSCKAIPEEIPEESKFEAKESVIIYYFGYCLSLAALCIALGIFLYFKDLRCIRNTIHTNLMVTYVLVDLTWIITATLNVSRKLLLSLLFSRSFHCFRVSFFKSQRVEYESHMRSPRETPKKRVILDFSRKKKQETHSSYDPRPLVSHVCLPREQSVIPSFSID